MQRNQYMRGFTLVELIVVITILAILGTISFISLIGFNRSARESVRISDINTIAKSIGFFYTQENYYPTPTDAFTVTFSGSVAWNQGTFGEDTRIISGRISEVPTDPLTENEYAYSITNTRQEYELGAISESILSNNSNLITNQANAASNYYTNIKGDYNQQIITVKEPTRIYILGVPTIITSEINDVTVQEIIANGTFAFKNSQNLPGSYSGQLNEDQTISDPLSAFVGGSLVDTTTPVIYEGTIEALSDDSEKQLFANNLISYYQGSNLNETNLPGVDQLLDPATSNPINALNYINGLITADTGGIPGDQIVVNEVIANTGTGSDTGTGSVTPPVDPPITPGVCLDDLTDTDVTTLNTVIGGAIIGDLYGNGSFTKENWCSITDFQNWYADSAGKYYMYAYWNASVGYVNLPGNIYDILAKIGSLTSLSLYVEAADIIPSEIGNIVSLTSLDISDIDYLTSIPSSISNLSNLDTLLLSATQLGNISTDFFAGSSQLCQSGITYGQDRICISGNGSTLNITVTPPSLPLGSTCITDITDPELATLNSVIGGSLVGPRYGNGSWGKFEWCTLTNLVNWQARGGDKYYASGYYGDGMPDLNAGYVDFPGSLYNILAKIDALESYSHYTQASSVPAEIGNMTSLTSIDFSDNQSITTLPAGVGNMTGLVELNLRNTWGMTSMGFDISNLVNLEVIRGDNSVFPTEIYTLTNLRILDMFQTCPSTLVGIGNLVNLEQLSLSRLCNQSSDNSINKLPAELENLTSLTQFALSNNSQFGTLSTFFNQTDSRRCEQDITPEGDEICIEGNGVTIDIEIIPSVPGPA